MNSGPNFPGVETASSKKDAVKKAFNQEYQATMKAMANAADRARTQILDQKLAAASHAQSSQSAKTGTAQPASSGPSSSKQTGTGGTGGGSASSAPADPGAMVMIEIANELRRIIVAEIDMRMNHLARQVEQAISNAIPDAPNAPKSAEPADTGNAETASDTGNSTAQPNKPASPSSGNNTAAPDPAPDPAPNPALDPAPTPTPAASATPENASKPEPSGKG